jgi:16S rRNA (guanine(527)-N(7))-methyltransferase RsmG
LTEIPDLSGEEFVRGLADAGHPVAGELADRLFAHFEELRRWAPRVALVGPAFAAELFSRHYGESLAGLELLPEGPGRLLDLGTGAGFPGLVLAAARPDLEVTLIEPRERKWAFLEAAARRAGVGCRVLNARVEASDSSLPREISSVSIVTVRALKLDRKSWGTIERRLAPGARLLLWGGEEPTLLPASFTAGREVRLPGLRRWIREYVWVGAVERAG